MRDPNRIPIILNELQKTWEQLPDLRFGQLVTVLMNDQGSQFQIEDDSFLEFLKGYNEQS